VECSFDLEYNSISRVLIWTPLVDCSISRETLQIETTLEGSVSIVVIIES